jgi:hypothetical protein
MTEAFTFNHFTNKEIEMTSLTPTQAHQDHTRWNSESAMWRDDIQQWNKEHKAARLALDDALATQNGTLSEHLESINQHGKKVKAAEHHIAEFERTMVENTDSDEPELNEHHRAEAETQNQLRDVHEQIKRHHYSAMAKLNVLVEAVQAQM